MITSSEYGDRAQSLKECHSRALYVGNGGTNIELSTESPGATGAPPHLSGRRGISHCLERLSS